MPPTSSTIYPSILPSPFIRLLHLDSGPDEPISVTLQEVNLKTAPAYDCLSYTWSDPLYHALSLEEEIHRSNDKREHAILCNGQELLITENLLLALREFSKRDNEVGSGKDEKLKRERLIWIDGICINQDSIEERNIQVGMMGDIYSKCSQVIVWLGVSDFHSPYAIEVMDVLCKIPETTYTKLHITDLEDWDIYPRLGIEVVETWQWLEYAAFLQRTWFSRIWVVQEAFLPKKIVVVCGSDIIQWADITACAKILRETGLGTLLMKLLIESVDDVNVEGTVYVNNTLNNQSIFQSMREMAKLGTEEMGRTLDLEKLLYYSRFFDATNPKDKIYAIRGIWQRGGKTIPKDMTPDYKMDPTVASVYSRAAWEIIFETQDLNILSLVEDYDLATQDPKSVRATENLPSWVPDFNSPSNPQPLAGNPRPQPGSERWNASRGLLFDIPTLPPLESRHLLPIKGYPLDFISESAATHAEIMGNDFGFTSVLELLFTYSKQKVPDVEHNRESYFEGFWRTLIKDTFRKLPANIDARHAFQYFIAVRVSELTIAYNYALSNHTPELSHLQKIYDQTKQLITTLSQHALNKSLIPSWTDLEELIKVSSNEDLTDLQKLRLDKDYGDFYEAFRIAYAGRRMFRTTKGYWGIAAQTLDSSKGDEVWIVAGLKVPVIFRRVDGSHEGNKRLIGEAYVYGFMNGEHLEGAGQRLDKIFLE